VASYHVEKLYDAGHSDIQLISSPGEWLLTFDDIIKRRRNRAYWCQQYGRNVYADEEAFARHELVRMGYA
jgi:hypothetical protein